MSDDQNTIAKLEAFVSAAEAENEKFRAGLVDAINRNLRLDGAVSETMLEVYGQSEVAWMVKSHLEHPTLTDADKVAAIAKEAFRAVTSSHYANSTSVGRVEEQRRTQHVWAKIARLTTGQSY